jgi:hypothetical protein
MASGEMTDAELIAFDGGSRSCHPNCRYFESTGRDVTICSRMAMRSCGLLYDIPSAVLVIAA